MQREQEVWGEKLRSPCSRLFVTCTPLTLSFWGNVSTSASLSRTKAGLVWTVPQEQHTATNTATLLLQMHSSQGEQPENPKVEFKGSSKSNPRSSDRSPRHYAFEFLGKVRGPLEGSKRCFYQESPAGGKQAYEAGGNSQEFLSDKRLLSEPPRLWREVLSGLLLHPSGLPGSILALGELLLLEKMPAVLQL